MLYHCSFSQRLNQPNIKFHKNLIISFDINRDYGWYSQFFSLLMNLWIPFDSSIHRLLYKMLENCPTLTFEKTKRWIITIFYMNKWFKPLFEYQKLLIMFQSINYKHYWPILTALVETRTRWCISAIKTLQETLYSVHTFL